MLIYQILIRSSLDPQFLSIFVICRTGFKLIILDEADNMTSAAQFALRRGSFIHASVLSVLVWIWQISDNTCWAVIENYTANTRFCLICNYVNKIIPALQSRCTRFRFSPLSSHHIRPRLQEIASAERYEFKFVLSHASNIEVCACLSIQVSDDALSAVEELSQGDMRKCLNILQVIFRRACQCFAQFL